MQGSPCAGGHLGNISDAWGDILGTIPSFTILKLVGVTLTGSLPPSMGFQFPYLTSLHLEKSLSSGSLPEGATHVCFVMSAGMSISHGLWHFRSLTRQDGWPWHDTVLIKPDPVVRTDFLQPTQALPASGLCCCKSDIDKHSYICMLAPLSLLQTHQASAFSSRHSARAETPCCCHSY